MEYQAVSKPSVGKCPGVPVVSVSHVTSTVHILSGSV